jgi:hypothetical protein
MPTYQAFQYNESNAVLGELRVLLGENGAQITVAADGTSVTYGDDTALPGVTVQLIGNGITGSPSSSWHITEIDASNSFGLVWKITGINDGDVTGTPTTGSFDATSLFQAETFRGAARLIFDGHNNTVDGGQGNEGLFGWGIDGNVGTINAGTGNDVIGPNGGLTTVNLKHGHDIIELGNFNVFDPMGNVATIHNYSTVRDTLDIERASFTHLDGNPTLLPKYFHIGANHPHDGSEQVWYNPHTGKLWIDFYSTFTHGEVKLELAQIYGPGQTHPHITAGDILYF